MFLCVLCVNLGVICVRAIFISFAKSRISLLSIKFMKVILLIVKCCVRC